MNWAVLFFSGREKGKPLMPKRVCKFPVLPIAFRKPLCYIP